MRRLLSIPRSLFIALLRYPRVTIALGVFFLICLVWVAGPMVGLQHAETRLILIVGALLVWSLYLILDRFRADRGAKRLEQSLQKQAQEQVISTRPDRKGEIETLRAQFDKAVASLKQSKIGMGRRGAAALYALPWYMFIGPPASGKSTALQHSGLQFPYLGASGKGIQGVGGTRNCDWWFTSEAVLLDTAGRYVTEEDDKEEWLAFLDMLKQCRKGKPINGVLAAISIADLLQATEDQVEWHAKNIRNRVDELIQRLGIVFPVYLVFTKCDLLRGFVEFFEDLSKTEREQVWGCTLSNTAPSSTPSHMIFDSEFQRLFNALQARRMTRLASARGSQKIRDIYGFPLQLVSGREKFARFVEILFQPNPYQESPIFRGFYFTSGTQEGTPIDRILSAVSKASGLPDVISEALEAQKETKSYFIKNLFTEIIFPDQILAGPSSAMVRQRGYIRVGIFVGAVLALVGSLVGLSFSFVGNKHLISSIRSASMKAVQMNLQDERQIEKNIELLDRLRARIEQLQEYGEAGPPLRLRGGLYQGSTLYQPLRVLYFDRFNELFLISTKSALEVELEGFVSSPNNLPPDRDSDFYYSLLKGYLMMSDPVHLNSTFLAGLLQKIWGDFLLRQYGAGHVPADLQGAVVRQIAFYSRQLGREGAPRIQIDQRLVKDAQRVLRDIPVMERLYARVRREALQGLESYTLQVALHGRRQDVLTSEYQIPGLFTEKGWRTSFPDTLEKVLEESGQEGWVLGVPEIDQTEMEKGVEKIYYTEYVRQWEKFLESVQIRPADSLPGIVEQLEMLIRDDSSLTDLLMEADKNSDLGRGAVSGGQGVALNLVRKVKKGLNLEGNPDDSRSAINSNPVSTRFQTFHAFVSPPQDQKKESPLVQYQRELARVHEILRTLTQSEGAGQDARASAQSIATGGSNDMTMALTKVESLLQELDPESRQAVSPILLQPFKIAFAGVMNQALGDLNSRWKTGVYEPCQQSIAGRYPFRQGGEDAALADVADFFHPQNGTLWKFYDKELKPFVEEGSERWEVKKRMGVGMALTPEFLESMRQARLITEGLFPRGNPDLKLSFGLYPYPSPGVSETLFQVDGKDLRYRNEPQEWHEFTWPGSSGTYGASLQANIGGARQARQYGGQWGLFKLLDNGRVTPIGTTRYQLEWNLNVQGPTAMKIRYDLRADSYKNPFKPGLFTNFQCVAKLG
ncbi:MAG: type VI secretion system membrane subunit TssM [Nitrospirae bacterium]|nr:type VI secretion system membrane subunit TssM [Nitrospirota bacterium]